MEVSVVMPAYNEAGSIEKAVKGISTQLQEMDISHEVIVSEDGSTDGTADIVRGIEQENVMLASEEERQGYTGSLKKGIAEAEGEYILFMDGDGQYFPEDFSDLWAERDEAEVVVGRRTDRADSLDRIIVSEGFQLVADLVEDTPPLEDMTSSFRLIDGEVAREIIPLLEHMRDSAWTEFGIRARRKGYCFREVPVMHRARPGDGDTRIYHLGRIPGIAAHQLKGLIKLRRDY